MFAPSDRNSAPLDSARGWGVTASSLLCLAVGPSSLLVASFGVLLGPMSQAYGWSPAKIGGAASAMTIAIMIASTLQGFLIDRFGVRRVVLTSIPLFVLSMLSMHWLPKNLTLLYLAWFVMPLMAVGLWPGSYLKAVSGWFDQRLGLATGLTNAGIGLGMLFGPMSVAWTIRTYGVHAAWIAMALLASIALPLALLGIREHPQHTHPRVATKASSVGEILSIPRYRIIIISFFLLGITGTGLVASIIPILTSKGLPLPAAAGAFAAFGIMSLVGRLLSGWLLDRLHVSRVLYLLGATTVVGLLAYVATGTLWMLILATALLGLMSGGEFDVLAYTLRRYFGLSAFGRMYGLAFSAFQLGASGGAALLALSIGQSGSYTAALVVFAIAATASMTLFGRIGPYPE